MIDLDTDINLLNFGSKWKIQELPIVLKNHYRNYFFIFLFFLIKKTVLQVNLILVIIKMNKRQKEEKGIFYLFNIYHCVIICLFNTLQQLAYDIISQKC